MDLQKDVALLLVKVLTFHVSPSLFYVSIIANLYQKPRFKPLRTAEIPL